LRKLSCNYFFSDGFVSDGFVSDGLISDGFVSDGFVSDGLVSFLLRFFHSNVCLDFRLLFFLLLCLDNFSSSCLLLGIVGCRSLCLRSGPVSFFLSL